MLLRGEAGLLDVPVLPPLEAGQPELYRTGLKIPFGPGENGPVCGFFRPGSHEIVDLHECAIQHPLLTEMLIRARALAAAGEVAIYDEVRHTGILRHLLGRVGVGSGESLLGLVVREAGSGRIGQMAQTLFEEFAPRGLVGVVENVNPDRTNVISGDRTATLAGRPFLRDVQDGLHWRHSITSFVQANPAQANRLYGEVLSGLGDLRDRRICDLFAGYGPIALRLARAGARVTAIERNEPAVADGRAAARDNQLDDRVRFVGGDALDSLQGLDALGLDAVVVDPPRRGLGNELIELLGELDFPRLIYVSCNPRSLARDLKTLGRSFAIESIRPVDLFPRTDHLESVSLLARRGPSDTVGTA